MTMPSWIQSLRDFSQSKLAQQDVHVMRLFLINLLVTVLIALLDVLLPRSVASSVPYVAVVVFSLWLPSARATLFFALLASVLVVFGYFFSPDVEGASEVAWQVLFNRGLGLFAIWVAAILVLHRKSADRELTRSERSFREIAETVPGIFWIYDAVEERWLYLSPEFESYFPHSAQAALENFELWSRSIHEDDRERVRRAFSACLTAHCPYEEEYRVPQRDGSVRWIHDRGAPALEEEGPPHRFLGVAVDVTEKREREEELARMSAELELQAHNDVLTGLPNRRSLEKALQRENHRAIRSGSRLIAILVDCDNFKRINDNYGHAVGDVVLREIGRRLGATVRPSDCAGRIGGDEFLVLLTDTRLAEAAQVAERIRLAMANISLDTYAECVTVTVSLGVAVVPLGDDSLEEVLTLTHGALARSKQGGKNRVVVETGADTTAATSSASKELVRQLDGVIDLHTVAQPIFELNGDKVVGYELFIRGPKGPFENPDDLFRACAERNKLTEIDLECLTNSTTWARKSHAKGRVHLNLFPSTLLNTAPSKLLSLLESAEDKLEFCLEISDQRFISNPDYLLERLRPLREAGVLLALDDVGFGRSSLESLIILEPDVIKIDKSLVRNIDCDAAKQHAFIRLHGAIAGLDAKIVAEGIETKAERSFLRDQGVSFGQGYLWGKPSAALSDVHVN